MKKLGNWEKKESKGLVKCPEKFYRRLGPNHSDIFGAVTRIRSKSKYRDNYSTAFGTITRIRPIIIITFGTINVFVHNSVTFGAGIDVGSCDCNIITVVPYQDTVTFSTVAKR